MTVHHTIDMARLAQLEQRVQVLEDVNAIRHLKARYAACCGQVKTDTPLSCLSDVFVRIGTDIPERRMFAPTVI
jgi:hypothetical protein